MCDCEHNGRKCSECGSPATIVEFQRNVKKGEPKLPNGTGSDDALYYCNECPPTGFDISVKPKKPKQVVGQKDAVATPGHRYLPYDEKSTQEVECFSCGNKHMLKDRQYLPKLSIAVSFCPNDTNCDSFYIKGYNEPSKNPPPIPLPLKQQWVTNKERNSVA